MRALTALALLFSTTAGAADLGFQLSGELGNLQNRDPAYETFSRTVAMPSRGLRIGVSVADTLTLEAGWHHVRRGLYDSDIGLATAFFADELTLGPKLSLPVGEVFFPYVAGHGLLLRSVVKLDDDTDTKNNLGQITQTAMTPGVLAMGGVEFRLLVGREKAALSWHLEAGYGWVGTATYGDIGEMQPGGFAIKSGLGIRL